MDPRYVKRRYLKPRNPGALTALSGFMANNKYRDKQTVQDTLSELKAFTYHVPTRKNYKRRPVICPYIDYLWASDLIFYDKWAYHNKNHRYILVVIDCFSKFLFCRPLVKKTADAVHDAFVSIFKSTKRSCSLLWVDRGGEYYAKRVQTLLKKHKIKMYSTYSKLKSLVAERVIKTIKGRIARYLTHNNSKTWISALDEIVQSYNNTYHSSIKTSPSEVTIKNESEIWHNLYDRVVKAKKIKPKYSVGSWVRISIKKIIFSKGYDQSWSSEVYKIKAIRDLHPVPVYTLEDIKGDELEGGFYQNEILKITNSKTDD